MHLSRIKFHIISIAALGLLLPAVSQASLSFESYKTPGDQDIVFDSSTNLEWLTLTYTQGSSVAALEAANPGFTLATPAQVVQLFDDAGGGFTAYDDTIRDSNPDLATATAIYQFFGAQATGTIDGLTYQADMYGVVLDAAGTGTDLYEVELRFNPFPDPGGAAELVGLGNSFSTSSSLYGAFMVMAAPEPGTVGFLAAGLLALAIAARFRSVSRRASLKRFSE